MTTRKSQHFFSPLEEDMFTQIYTKIEPTLIEEIAQAAIIVAKEALQIGTQRAVQYLQTYHTPQPSSEDLILTLLQTPQHIDDLHVQSRIPIPTLHAVLLQMEFAGKIQQRPGKIFARA
jgi:predicted Rossmann fold nucleotide-binding protein DprA/Smf involved in DNA uptake